HTIASPIGLPALWTTTSGGTGIHSPVGSMGFGMKYPAGRISQSVRCPSAISQQRPPLGLRSDLNQDRRWSGTSFNWPLAKPAAVEISVPIAKAKVIAGRVTIMVLSLQAARSSRWLSQPIGGVGLSCSASAKSKRQDP